MKGGKRAGAGRPPKDPRLKVVKMLVSLPPDLRAWVMETSVQRSLSQSEVVREALEAKKAAKDES